MKAKQKYPTISGSKCPYCKKDKHAFAITAGRTVRDQDELSEDMETKREDHPWELKSEFPVKVAWNGSTDEYLYTESTIQPHHLITVASLKEKVEGSKHSYTRICIFFGYNVNCKENGVWFPSYPELACQLNVPIHKGSHSKKKYRDYVDSRIKNIFKSVSVGDYCPPKGSTSQTKFENFQKSLHAASSDIFNMIMDKNHPAVISKDGADYQKGNPIGCGNKRVPGLKPKNPQMCKHGRNHKIKLRPHIPSIGN